jgi:hypothetical protein
MRLNDLAYDPQQTPEAQHQLRQIPPAERVDHPELKAALEHYEQAKADEHTKRRDAIQAEQDLPDAERLDALALADAQAEGKRDPGGKHRTKALDAIAEARRQHAASVITLQRAVEAVVIAFRQYGSEWEASLDKERDQLRSQMAEALDRWAGLHVKLQANSANRAIPRGSATQSPSLYADSIKVPVRDGDVIYVADVTEALRDLAKPQDPNKQAVENLELGAEPTRHRPPAEQPHFSGGGAVQMGARRDPALVQAWVEQDEAEALARGAALTEKRRDRA